MREGNDHGGVQSAFETELDAVLVALAHPYRRYLLEYMDESGSEATVTELAAAIGQGRESRAATTGTPRGIDRIETTLYHAHLPKLADIGVVTFDPSAGTVQLTSRWTEVRPILDAAEHLRPEPR